MVKSVCIRFFICIFSNNSNVLVMKFKGTKGKWVLNKHVIESDLGCDIAEVWDYNDEENQANALLISKAPEILDMLKLLLEGSNAPEWKQSMAKKLIKQATDYESKK